MELRDIARTLTRHIWLLIGGTVLAVAGTYFAFRVLTPWPRYAAASTVIVSRNNLSSEWASLQANRELATTYAEWATRRPVLEGVIDSLGLSTSADELRGRIQARPVGNTQLMEISATSRGRHEAANIANEVVRQLEVQIQHAVADEDGPLSPSREEVAELQQRISSTEAELGALTDLLLETDSLEEADLLTRQTNVLRANLEMWRREYEGARAQLANRSQIRLVVVEEAQPPVQAANPLVNILVAGAAGLVATSAAVLLLEAGHPSIKGQASSGLFASLRDDIGAKCVGGSEGGDLNKTSMARRQTTESPGS